MRIIYTAQKSGFEAGIDYRHPKWFTKPQPNGQAEITIVGDWPAVKSAYEAIGVKVMGDKPDLDLTREGIDAMGKETLIGLLEAHGVTADKRKGAATLAEELKTVVFI